MYRTNALNLASFLVTEKETEFVGVDASNPQSLEFIFENKKVAEKAAKEYFSGKARVNPLELFKSYHMLKSLVYDGRRKDQLIQPE